MDSRPAIMNSNCQFGCYTGRVKRIEHFRFYVEGKNILDLGCVDHEWQRSREPDWLHGQLCRVAASVTGLDARADGVAALREQGFHILEGDVEAFDLRRTFDVVVACELIEHVSNVGNFLECVKRHLVADGVFLLTTPNVFAFGNLLRIIRLAHGRDLPDNPEHTHWQSAQTLRGVLERHGFVVEHMTTIVPDRYPPWLERWIPLKVRSKLFVVARHSERVAVPA